MGALETIREAFHALRANKLRSAATPLALPPVLTLSGGLLLAVVFVIARSWIVAREHPSA